MKTSNPFLKGTSQNVGTGISSVGYSAKGATNKTLLGLAIMALIIIIASSSTTLLSIISTFYLPIAIGTSIAMIVLGMQVSRDPSKAKTLFFVYSILEGLLLSVFVYAAEMILPGVGISAAFITFLIVLFMYTLYKLSPGLIRTLTPVIMGVVFVLGILFLINFVFAIFGASFLPYDSVGFILVLLVISSFSIAMDFRQIDVMNHLGLPKEYEWVGALGLLTSIVWTFINVIRLLLARSND